MFANTVVQHACVITQQPLFRPLNYRINVLNELQSTAALTRISQADLPQLISSRCTDIVILFPIKETQRRCASIRSEYKPNTAQRRGVWPTGDIPKKPLVLSAKYCIDFLTRRVHARNTNFPTDLKRNKESWNTLTAKRTRVGQEKDLRQYYTGGGGVYIQLGTSVLPTHITDP